MDQVYGKSQAELVRLKEENKDLSTEVQQLKTLNQKLTERVDYLQSIIEKEASANTYYFNYPPKAEATDDKQAKKTAAADSEVAKVKKMYEDQMELQKKQYENQIKTLKQSTSAEAEELQEMLSGTSRELIVMTHKFYEIEKNYKLYYKKSCKYIDDREAKLQELQAECNRMANEYGRFDEKFAEERHRADRAAKELDTLEVEHQALKTLSHKQRLEIIDYEERYKGIDISKLHEQIQYLQSQTLMAQLNEKAMENDLFQFREKIHRLASHYSSAGGPSEKELKAKRRLAWRGPEEVEELCQMFTSFLTSPSQNATSAQKR